ncbi:uncharacterized protein LOC143290536 [Babylonia areolata]|uniref:uncharacterized protein LOC143290536 n=1 Tax=Babylonia areolata TaxID=304850 RepID=UPI003FD2B2FB
MKKIQTFINTCLRTILLRIRLPNTISCQDIWQRTNQQPVEDNILRRHWRWIGHTLRKPASRIHKTTPHLVPSGGKRGRPRNSWCRDLETDIRRMGHTSGQLERLAQDQGAWRALVKGMCPRRDHRRR